MWGENKGLYTGHVSFPMTYVQWIRLIAINIYCVYLLNPATCILNIHPYKTFGIFHRSHDQQKVASSKLWLILERRKSIFMFVFCHYQWSYCDRQDTDNRVISVSSGRSTDASWPWVMYKPRNLMTFTLFKGKGTETEQASVQHNRFVSGGYPFITALGVSQMTKEDLIPTSYTNKFLQEPKGVNRWVITSKSLELQATV